MSGLCPLFPEEDEEICLLCIWPDTDEFDNDNDICPHDEKLNKETNTCPMFSCGQQCRACPSDCPHLCRKGQPGGVVECKDCGLPCPYKNKD